VRDLSDDFASLTKRLGEAEAYLGLERLRARLIELEKEVGRPDLWDDPDVARKVSTEYNTVNADVELLTGLRQRLEDAETLNELAVEEADESVASELEDAVTDLGRRLDDLEVLSLFSGEYDQHDAVCEIHAGAGGTDAQDWAQMMLRMYQRWAERRGVEFEGGGGGGGPGGRNLPPPVTVP